MSKQPLRIGMDIGANAIRAIFLSSARDGFKLEFMRAKLITTTFTENGSIMDYGELVHGIKNIIGSETFPSKDVIVALKGPAVIIRKTAVYSDGVDDLEEELRWFIDQYAAIDTEEMSVDYKILGPSSSYSHTDVVIVASKRDTITDFDSVVKSSNLILYAVEPEALSLERLYNGLGLPKTGITAILHVGVVGSLIVFLKNGRFDFACDLNRGGKHFTEAIKNEFGLNFDEAETIKQHPDSFDKPAEVRAALNRIITLDFLHEMDNALKLYLLRGGSEPEGYYLSGAACVTEGLSEAVFSKYSVPVNFLDPWSRIEVPSIFSDSFKLDYSFNIALGLAMYGVVY